ncbi:recombinase family protein [Clostridium oryzae]|uniref:DNA-invertase hin n=1 Tax=Clostridium oryzae TaxID=1450648 RepID=A0A1V4IP92_9CLOT|nr:recombinase family protein [Clostridium oryzae]OPJ61640.1 DNA-invertase hin [Clostridium oryzae]
MNIAIYSRKSIETDTGESIKNQVNLCKDYFMKRYDDCEFTIFEDEGFSGSNINRPSFLRMMDYAKSRHFEIIATYKIDRIARNIVDFVNIFDTLEKYSVKLVSITEGFDASKPTGKMLMLILASFAEMERLNISERVSDNMLELAKLGRWTGGKVPLGYKSMITIKNNKKAAFLELIESESSVIKNIFELYVQDYSASYISRFLKERNYTFSANSVLNIITNPTYLQSSQEASEYLRSIGYTVYGTPNGYGYLPYNRKPNKNNSNKAKAIFAAVSVHQPIIALPLWKKANELLKSKSTFSRSKQTHYSFLNSRIIICKKCEKSMKICLGHKRKDGSRLYYFKCPLCGADYLRVDILENAILHFFAALIDRTILDSCVSKNNINSFCIKEIRKLNKKINSNRLSIDNLISNLCFIKAPSSIEIISDKIECLSKENNKLKSDLSLIENQLISLNSFDSKTIYQDIKRWLTECSISTKKDILASSIDYILYDAKASRLNVKLRV